jgi:hypothetical protein
MKHLADCSGRPGSVLGTLLALLALTSLCLNLWGNSWGTPDRWHPDEMDGVAAGLVAQKTLNPHFFPYGGLHYYVLAATAAIPVGIYNYLFDQKPAPTDARALAAWRDRKDTRVRVFARATSAVMATLTVFITYAIATLLFGRTAGLLAALFLAVSPYFVLIAHFATVDTAANFWYWLACLLTLFAWKRSVLPWYALAAFAVGLACGTKLDRVLAVIPWIAAGLLWQPPRLPLRRWLGNAVLIPVGYVAANPTLLLSPFEFIDGTSKDLMFNALRGDGTTSFVQMLADMATGMSTPLFTICVVALAYLCYGLVRGSLRREFAWVLATIAPMYVLFGSRYSMPWYSAFFFPGLAIIGAQGCVTFGRASRRVVSIAAAGAVLAAASWALLRSVAVDQQFQNDSRYAAAAWIEQHVPHGATIEMSHRGPILAAGLYEVQRDAIPQDYYDEASEWRRHLEASRLYQTVQGVLLALERFDASSSDAGREPTYRAWFDRVTHADTAASPMLSTGREADYRVVVDYLDATGLRKLQTPGSGYLPVGEFRYCPPLGMDVPFPFINPTTYVFKRTMN